MADNRRVLSVTIDRAEIRSAAKRKILFTRLSGPLQTPVEDLEARYADVQYDPYLPLPLADDVPETTAIYLGERREDYPGVEVSEGWQRVYRYAPLASHIVGYMGAIPAESAKAYTGQGLQAERAGRQGRHRGAVRGPAPGQAGLRSPTRSTPATASSGRSAGGTRCRATTSSSRSTSSSSSTPSRRCSRACGRRGRAARSTASPSRAAARRSPRPPARPWSRTPATARSWPWPPTRPSTTAGSWRASRTRRSRSCTPTPTSRPRSSTGRCPARSRWARRSSSSRPSPGCRAGIITPGSPYNDQGRYQIPNCDVAKFKCIFKNAGLARGSGPISLATALTISSGHVLLPHRRRAAAGPEPDAAERRPAVRLRLGQRHRPAGGDLGDGARRRAEEAPGRAQPAGHQPGRGPGLLRRRQRAVRHRPGPAQRHPAPADQRLRDLRQRRQPDAADDGARRRQARHPGPQPGRRRPRATRTCSTGSRSSSPR